jgi:uncharacterized membrane protein
VERWRRWSPAAPRAPAATALFGLTGAIALGALAIDGHVATVRDTPVLAAIGQILHLLSGGVWMGAVMVLALCLVPAALAASRADSLLAAVRAYAPIAIVAAVVTVVTGLIAAVREVSRWYFLRWSSYGHILIIKVVIVGGVIVLGGATTLLARRALARGGSTPAEQRRAGWFMRAEALMAVVTIAIAALLAGTLQGRGQPLPSQRGNLLPGAGFANVALPNATGEMVLAPSDGGPEPHHRHERGGRREHQHPAGAAEIGLGGVRVRLRAGRAVVPRHIASGKRRSERSLVGRGRDPEGRHLQRRAEGERQADDRLADVHRRRRLLTRVDARDRRLGR